MVSPREIPITAQITFHQGAASTRRVRGKVSFAAVNEQGPVDKVGVFVKERFQPFGVGGR